MSDPNEDLVSQFMAFTGSADGARATSYLEMSGWNLDTAVSLYMEHEGGGSSSGGGGGMGGGEMDIRAPDRTQTMRLMDDNVMHSDPSYQMMSALMEEQLARSAFASRFLAQDVRAQVNDAAAIDMDDEAKEIMDTDDDEDLHVVSGPARLSDMFAAPNHLIHRAGGFQGARAMAKDARRWLLVNIQRDSEFSSHALNRDVWRDELVENLIREGFIFWQQMDIHPEGRTYIERYQVMDYPHIAIIDPRTGRLLWRKEGWTQQNPLTAELFAEYAMDFCSRNTFDRPPQAPRPGASLPSKRPALEMSEEEQLNAAMKASMEDTKPASVEKDENSDENSVEFIADSDEEEDVKAVAAPQEKPKSLHDELLAMSIGDEPADGARIQLRMPDGKRVVRKFAGSDSLKTIYAFVAQTNDEARGGKEFALMAGYPPSDLASNDIDKDTVEGCKVAGQAITVRWK